MSVTEILSRSNQLKNEYISHGRVVDKFENVTDFHELTTNKLNKVFHESDKLSSKSQIRRTNERMAEPDADRYKIIVVRPNMLFKSNIKDKLNNLIELVDCIIAEFDRRGTRKMFSGITSNFLCFYLATFS